jgi:acetylornithine deacetylase
MGENQRERTMSDALLSSTLGHLERLVSFDTRNPPREIGTGGIFDYLQSQLAGFRFTVTDHGAGAVSLLAVRGNPRVLFNVHLDTVPAAPGWSGNPLQLRINADKAFGLGACDIKGAAAALLAAAEVTSGDAAFLFSTDEEANDARCIAGFLQTVHGFTDVIVSEPTGCRAVLAHRGIVSVQVGFTGTSGHASKLVDPMQSAVHQALRWGGAALDYAEKQAHQRFGGLTGMPFNIGKMQGGIKANMIAGEAGLRIGFRPLPTQSLPELHAGFAALLPGSAVDYQITFTGLPLPAGDTAMAESRRLQARDFAEELGLPIGHAVDFWTEAALFSEAGLNAIVFGPGDIAQAHSADEWVALPQLQTAASHYAAILD